MKKKLNGQPQKQYFMIAAKWLEQTEGSLIETPGAPALPPLPQVILRNEVIDTHPLDYAIGMLGSRKDFVVLWATPITREKYDAVINANEVAKQAEEAAERERAEAENAKPN